ncbi:hypothetical protein [Roseicitreum antarcticum]|uniref:Uncharacterized protein n=1 Tax=Roseicitreum antarcticum TaxID=564137 RepID=A0A1H3AML9_9RHOB|nr:hypothetical protein [Roseicitreum antarcticum]SDX30926.1 hypothetical protein SAMN04488238_10761 [Roseicitreum antarcticum]
MKRIACLMAVLALAACGVDGPPQAPDATPGVSVSGEMRLGVVKEL